VYDAAVTACPFSQAAKNFAVVSMTSDALGGPVFTDAGPPEPPAPELPPSADTRLYAPYPAPDTITANTLPMTVAFTPLRMAQSSPRYQSLDCMGRGGKL